MLCSHAWAQLPSLEVQHFMTLFKQQTIVTNSALIYWHTFSLLVESTKKLDTVVITHNFSVTQTMNNCKAVILLSVLA